MTDRAKSRLSLVQSAYVVARRDFRAILFSKAFLFFLLGPVIFGVITLGAASVGQKAAENRDPPVLAVAMAGAAEALPEPPSMVSAPVPLTMPACPCCNCVMNWLFP